MNPGLPGGIPIVGPIHGQDGIPDSPRDMTVGRRSGFLARSAGPNSPTSF
jgi:hypothetical protein